jgi:hypothetical protein
MQVTGWQRPKAKPSEPQALQAFKLAAFFFISWQRFTLQRQCQVEVFLNRYFFGPSLDVKGACKVSFSQPRAQGVTHQFATLTEGHLHQFF